MALRFRHRGDCVRNALSALSVRANVEQVKINTVNRVFDGSATPTLQRPTRRPEPTDLRQLYLINPRTGGRGRKIGLGTNQNTQKKERREEDGGVPEKAVGHRLT